MDDEVVGIVIVELSYNPIYQLPTCLCNILKHETHAPLEIALNIKAIHND